MGLYRNHLRHSLPRNGISSYVASKAKTYVKREEKEDQVLGCLRHGVAPLIWMVPVSKRQLRRLQKRTRD